MLNSTKIQFALVIATTIIVPSLADYALSAAGFDDLGGLVWAVGYGFGVIAIWFIWIRPIDFAGSTDEES